MEVVFEKKTKIKPLRLAHFNQLMSYIEDCESQGWYYGQKDQFEKRRQEIKAWVQDCIDTLENKK